LSHLPEFPWERAETMERDCLIDVNLDQAEQILSSIHADLNYVKKMSQALEEIHSSKLFSSQERKVFEQSFQEAKVDVAGSIDRVVMNINEAKEWWSEKQKKMHQLYNDKLLTEEVAKVWDQSLQESGNRIEKIEKSILFYDQHKMVGASKQPSPIADERKHKKK
jgi:hypothetical protein